MSETSTERVTTSIGSGALLPQGWRSVPLSEVIADAQPGFACGERDPAGVVQLRMNNVSTRGQVDFSQVTRIPVQVADLGRFALVSGDILFNNTNSAELVGKTAVFTGHSEPVVYSNHFTRLRVKPNLANPDYVGAWLLHQWQSKVFERICNRWIGQSAVKNDKLLALVVPLPPVEEQGRIAAIFSEGMAAVQRARAVTEVQLEASNALSAAYLRTVFVGPEAQQWPVKRLGDVCEIQLGKMLSPKSKIGQTPRPYLRNFNVQWARFDLSDVAKMDFSEREAARFALKKGDLLVCEGGEPGRAAVWQGEIEPCYYQKALHRLRPISEAVDPHFVMYRLWGELGSEFSDSHAKTTIAHLPAIRLKELPIGLPALSVQRTIVTRLLEKLADVDRLRKTLDSELRVIEHLPAALLRDGFNGEL